MADATSSDPSTYDELGLFHENAAEAGLDWHPPTVRRVQTAGGVPPKKLFGVPHTRTSSPSVAVKLRSTNLPEPRSPTTSPSLYTSPPRTYTEAGPPVNSTPS